MRVVHGNGNKVCDGFDKRRKAKAGVGVSPAQDLGESGDMFAQASAAAE